MKDEISIVSFNPDEASEEILEAYLDFDEKITLELIPEQGLTSKEAREKNLKVKNPARDSFFWIALKQYNSTSNVVGYSRLSIENPTSPHYEKNGHIAGCSVLVLAEFSRKKIGSNLLEEAIQEAKNHSQVTDLMFRTYNGSGYSFLEKKGAKMVLEQNRSYLKLSEVNLDLMNKWNSSGNELETEDQIKLLEIEGSIPEDIIEEYATLYTEVMNQQPLGSLQMRPLITADILRTRAAQMEKKDQHWHTLLTIENNGEISGLTEFQYSFNQPDMIFQLLTGVKEEYRQRGIGKWLKAKMLLFIKKKYPDAKYIETTNTTTNEAMVSINRRMGFYDKEPLKFYEMKTK